MWLKELFTEESGFLSFSLSHGIAAEKPQLLLIHFKFIFFFFFFNYEAILSLCKKGFVYICQIMWLKELFS